MDYKVLFKNSTGCMESDKGILPLRFTPKQLELYKNAGPFSEIRSRCTAGIFMDFCTFDEEISFSYELEGVVRNHFSFDFYENDLYFSSVRKSDTELSGTIVYRKQTAGKTRLSIYLPYTGPTWIRDIRMDTCEDAKDCRSGHLLMLGDSITQGIETERTSFCHATFLSRVFNMHLLNQGVGGYVFDADSVDDKLGFRPDTVFVSYGTNDYTVSRDANVIRESAERYISRVRELFKSARIYVVSPIWRFFEEEKDYAEFFKVHDMLQELADRYQCRYIDGRNLVPHNKQFFYDEEIHPNESGFFQYGYELLRAMSPTLS